MSGGITPHLTTTKIPLSNGHAWLRISATFTIGYGKELRRGNEVGSKGEVDKGALEVD